MRHHPLSDLVPLEKDDTVVLSCLAEIALGGAVVLAGPAHQKAVGRVAGDQIRKGAATKAVQIAEKLL